MDNKKIGEFISTLRKSKNLTQKELADQLGITDKAVSKWERGAGYPDISMLRPLAEILGTTVNELLEGEATGTEVETETAMNYKSALNYANQLISFKEKNMGKLLSAIISIALLIAIFTSVIVNIAVNKCLSWSILVIAGCLLGGCLFIPPLLFRKRGLTISLILLTILIIPFLEVIEYESAKLTGYSGWLWKLGFPISITWLLILWFMVFIIRKTKLSIWFYASISGIIIVAGDLYTNYVINEYLGIDSTDISSNITNISTAICILTLAGICFIIGLIRRK